MSALAIILIIFIALYLLREPISRWLSGFMARRAEDTMRRMMGMPTRKEEERRRKAAEREASRGAGRQRGGFSYQRGPDTYDSAPTLREYAEDVDFEEFKDYSTETRIGAEGPAPEYAYAESQVEDAQYVEIKEKRG